MGASTSSARSRPPRRSTKRCAPRAMPSAAWRNTPLAERAAILTRFCDEFEKRGAKIAEELTWQMGRPARYAPNEVRGTLERARHMIAIAPQALADLDAGPKDNFKRFVRREPLGVVFTVAAWNYPYPHRREQRGAGAHGRQCRDPQAFGADAAVPPSVSRNASKPRVCRRACSRSLHASHEDTDRIIRDPRVDFVAFTGSVAGGHAVQRAAAHALHRRGPRARRLRPGVRAPRCQPRRTPSRTSSMARISIPGSPAADCSACTCTTALYQKFADGFVELTRKYALGDPTRCGHHARAAGAHRGRRRRARADRGVDRGGRHRR